MACIPQTQIDTTEFSLVSGEVFLSMTGETIYVYVHHLMVLFNSSAKYLWLLNNIYKYIAY